MNTKIETLQRALTETKAEQRKLIDSLEYQLRDEYRRVFGFDRELQEAIGKLNCYERVEYGCEENGYYAWIRCYVSEFDTKTDLSLVDALNDYLSDHGMEFDAENDALKMNIGGRLVVVDSGDVLDSETGRTIIARSAYADEAERNALIEAWMEKNGYFPGVFSQDIHGNVFAIDTRKSA